MQVILLLLLPLASQARARRGEETIGAQLGAKCAKVGGIWEDTTCEKPNRLVLSYM